jgi:hypothetical protein
MQDGRYLIFYTFVDEPALFRTEETAVWGGEKGDAG